MIERMIRAVKLDAAFYREVRDDPSLDQEALTVVILVAAVNAGLGFLVSAFVSLAFGGFGSFLGTIINAVLGFIATVVLFFIGAYAIWYIGTNFFNGTGTPEGVRRALAYAYTPNIIGAIPCIGIIGAIWSLVAFFIATRESMEMDNTNTALTIVAYVVIVIIVSLVLGAVGIGAGLGLGALSGLGR